MLLPFLLSFAALLALVTGYHRFKPVPARVHGELMTYRVPAAQIDFVWNLTWYENEVRRTEQDIFREAVALITNAQQRIIFDIFLFNEIVPQGEHFQATTDQITQALLEKKRQMPEIDGVIITDPVNTFYGMDYSHPLSQLHKAGYEIIITDIDRLRDNNLFYSGLWRLLFGWQQSGAFKIIPHPLRPRRHTSVRALLKAFNARGNHRKVLICDDKLLISSSNFDNKSSYYCDVGIRLQDRQVTDFFAFTEFETARLSGYDSELYPAPPEDDGEGDVLVSPLLGANIRKRILDDIEMTKEGDAISIGMLFIAHRAIIRALKRAVARGVKVDAVLDKNALSFGKEKIGMPNRMIGPELEKSGIIVRWFLNRQEEFHTKLVYIRSGSQAVMHIGSANLTRRSLLGTNLESNIRLECRRDAAFIQKVEAYLKRISEEPFSSEIGRKPPRPFWFWHWYCRFLERSGGATF